LKRLFDRITFKKENSNMKEKKNRLSKLSIVAFVIVSFCVVSVSTQSSQAQTVALSSDTSFIGIIWGYFFPTANTNNSSANGENPNPTPTPTDPEIGVPVLRTPTPCIYPPTTPRERCGTGPGSNGN
jgi:hypothetical protein